MTTASKRIAGAPSALAGLAAAMAIGACAPALDWRETRPEGTEVAMLFPCRPERQERSVKVGEDVIALRLFSCTAAGAAFALAAADVSEPGRVTPLLEALRGQVVANVGGIATIEVLPALPGATPNAQSARVRIVGKRRDGRRVVEHALFFVKGLTLFQATVIGADEAAGREAIDTFFDSIRLP